LFIFIDKIPRKKAGVILFAIAGACASLLLFITKPNDCGGFCVEGVL